ncbi:hypothetical protein TSMEX_006752, partial [Taenia solium]
WHFDGVSSTNPQSPAAFADLFDFDSAGADVGSNGSGGSGGGVGNGIEAVDEVSHPASDSCQQHGPHYQFRVPCPHGFCAVANLAVSKWSHRLCQLLHQTLLMPHLPRDSR